MMAFFFLKPQPQSFQRIHIPDSVIRDPSLDANVLAKRNPSRKQWGEKFQLLTSFHEGMVLNDLNYSTAYSALSKF